MGLAQFSGRDTEDRRLQFIFRIYDMDRDGYISNGELYQVKIVPKIVPKIKPKVKPKIVPKIVTKIVQKKL